MGYFIGEAYWGSGIATEAVRLLTQYICTLPNMVRIQAKVFSGNLASTRVLEKNGFILEATHQQAVYKNNQLLDEQIWIKLTQPSV
jgi:RimJ/RimL family protein N-acetyltransferase